jgi:hypothetical protein
MVFEKGAELDPHVKPYHDCWLSSPFVRNLIIHFLRFRKLNELGKIQQPPYKFREKRPLDFPVNQPIVESI